MPPRRSIRTLTLNLAPGESSITEIGKALGPTGANLAEFRTEYDAATVGQRGHTLPAVVTV